MANVLKSVKKINRKPLNHARREDILNEKFEGIDGPIDTQHLLISTLLPPAVKMFIRDCVDEVEQLCGERYKHGKENVRWGDQKGSIVLANQQVAVPKLRVRSKSGEEVPLKTYEHVRPETSFTLYTGDIVYTFPIKEEIQWVGRRVVLWMRSLNL